MSTSSKSYVRLITSKTNIILAIVLANGWQVQCNGRRCVSVLTWLLSADGKRITAVSLIAAADRVVVLNRALGV